jgi:hypothetical protein
VSHPTPRQRVLAAAKVYGAKVEWVTDRRCTDVSVDAPPGKVWNANFCHVISRATYHGRAQWVENLADDVIRDVTMGVVDCPDRQCETCCEPE